MSIFVTVPGGGESPVRRLWLIGNSNKLLPLSLSLSPSLYASCVVVWWMPFLVLLWCLLIPRLSRWVMPEYIRIWWTFQRYDHCPIFFLFRLPSHFSFIFFVLFCFAPNSLEAQITIGGSCTASFQHPCGELIIRRQFLLEPLFFCMLLMVQPAKRAITNTQQTQKN